jgi:predicted permease
MILESLWQDLRFAARSLRKNPGFTLVTAFSLALGIGANTTIFSLVNALLVRPLPIADPARLVRVGSSIGGQDFLPVSLPEYRELTNQNQVFDGLAAHTPSELSLSTGGDAQIAWGETVSTNYFDVLGVHPILGRSFSAEDGDAAASAPLVVMSHALWLSRFGGDPGILGKTIRINSHPFEVVGVAPPGFSGTFYGFSMDLWVPVEAMLDAGMRPGRSLSEHWDARFLLMVARLKPRASVAQARVQITALGARLAATHPDADRGRSLVVAQASGVHPFIAGLMSVFLALLMGMVGLVLLVACANAASLLLARSQKRQREIAVRLALGANRSQLIRLLLAESLLLAVGGGVMGFLLAIGATRALEHFRPPAGIPISLHIALDFRVLVFTLSLSILTGIIFGISPALRTSRPNLVASLNSERGASSTRTSRLQSLLVAAQVSLTMVLLFGVGLLVRSLIRSVSVDSGYDSRRVVVATFETSLLGLDSSRLAAFYADLKRAVSSISQVEEMSLSGWVPLSDRGDNIEINLPNRNSAPDANGISVSYNLADDNYFHLLGLPVLRGRAFNLDDRPNSPLVAIVNSSFARSFWPAQDALGKSLRIVGEHRDRLIVGIVRDAKYASLAEDPRPFLYLPVTQYARQDLTLFARVAGDPHDAISAIEHEVHRINPDVPIYEPQTMVESMAFATIPARLAARVLGACGSIALLLTSVGIYGLLSYSVSQRTQEIGIRMALGAQRRDLFLLILRQSLLVVGTGVCAGLFLAVGAGRLLRGMLYGVSPADPTALATISALLIVLSILAAYIPARRAMRMDPLTALRYE